MIELYRIAIDPNMDLETRYSAIILMQQKQKKNPRNYLKLQNRAARQRRYNQNRIDWRVIAK